SIGRFPTPDLEAFFRATQRVQEEGRAQVGISRRGSKMTFVLTARNTAELGFAQMEAAQPIKPGALRPHRYMGTCTNCHVFMRSGGQLPTDAGDILPNPPPITRNAKAPHRYRGQCATCHTIK
ncbi:MAG: magnetochrome domain-containing protein, partial [Planctomycetota bacterium]